MFIIHRREVQSDGKRDKVDAVYWILDDRIYPTPSLYDIMANRTVCLPCPSFVSRLLADLIEKRCVLVIRDLFDVISTSSTLESKDEQYMEILTTFRSTSRGWNWETERINRQYHHRRYRNDCTYAQSRNGRWRRRRCW